MNDSMQQGWQKWAETWEEDWSLCVDYLVDHTDIEDRTQALLYMIARHAQGWNIGMSEQNNRARDLMPKVARLLDHFEDEIDDAEDWKP